MSVKANSIRVAAGMSLAMFALIGCEARQLGINYADKQAGSVDGSWVTAAKSCWPDLGHRYGDESLKQYLADPLHMRAAFTAYSSMNDADLRSLVTKTVMSAPAPDASLLSHSQNAVITRYQALHASNVSLVSANNADSAAPADALCAVLPGTPVGFK